MALRFKCQDCGADIIAEFAKIGETVVCNSCENYSMVPETAVEVSEDAYDYFRKHGVAPEEEPEMSMPRASRVAWRY